MDNTIKIDNKEYNVDALSDEAKQTLNNIQVCDKEIQRLRSQIAITEVARATFINTLKNKLPS